ncbi:MAG: Rieske (2Fe-2S) protein [Actinomycetota bacterium]|nr:Rieske (2Fe-2S) protein [Actinomycetota bacterium]
MATRWGVLAFVASTLGSTGLVVAYVVEAGPQWQGVALSIGLAGLGAGLVAWSKGLMPQGPEVEDRPDLEPSADEERETAAAFTAGRRSIGRRRLFASLLVAATGAFVATIVTPIRSLGPAPRDKLRASRWGAGVRVVDEEGHPVAVEELDVGGVLTVFPEGAVQSADDQTVLLRVGLEELQPLPGREDWSPEGYLAYSKICTHAGCPVGLFQTDTQVLLCPCHQATFAVLDGARTVFGPAPRPLPQLPLAVDRDGFLVARGDFSEPPGPGRWSLGQP